jgi:hypothetical protein
LAYCGGICLCLRSVETVPGLMPLSVMRITPRSLEHDMWLGWQGQLYYRCKRCKVDMVLFVDLSNSPYILTIFPPCAIYGRLLT